MLKLILPECQSELGMTKLVERRNTARKSANTGRSTHAVDPVRATIEILFGNHEDLFANEFANEFAYLSGTPGEYNHSGERSRVLLAH